MSHSYCRVAIHLIFSTKNRRPLITTDIRDELHAYMVWILRHLESLSLITNTATDHAHSLFLQSKKQAIDLVIEALKRGSSKWIKTKGPSFADFYWQTGYAAFSVGQNDIDSVKNYISNQQEHHRKMSFEEEIRNLFRHYGQSLDEKNFFP